jgi:hypothetical protein
MLNGTITRFWIREHSRIILIAAIVQCPVAQQKSPSFPTQPDKQYGATLLPQAFPAV